MEQCLLQPRVCGKDIGFIMLAPPPEPKFRVLSRLS
jgi:hypothetical protein